MLSVSDLPTLNAVLNFTSAVLLALGGYFIHKRDIEAHKKCMIAAVFVSIAFLTSYVIYHYHAGSVPFGRQGWLRPVYFFILITHIFLAVVNLPLALRTVYLGLNARYGSHVAIAKWTFPVWMYVSVTGVVVYVMLYHL
jgi:putative membrane protein